MRIDIIDGYLEDSDKSNVISCNRGASVPVLNIAPFVSSLYVFSNAI